MHVRFKSSEFRIESSHGHPLPPAYIPDMLTKRLTNERHWSIDPVNGWCQNKAYKNIILQKFHLYRRFFDETPGVSI